MTTLISLAARDFIVVGCDSLATSSADLVYAGRLTHDYFDQDGFLKLDEDGRPLLKSATQIWEKAESIPTDNLPSVTKLFHLEPYRACLLFAGATRIGETTVLNIVETFKLKMPKLGAKPNGKNKKIPYSMEDLAEKLKDHILQIYSSEFKDEFLKPSMEIILSGYSEEYREPELWRLQFSYNRNEGKFLPVVTNAIPRKNYNVIFGGQSDVVQRVVNGIDQSSLWSIRGASFKILNEFFDEMQEQLVLADSGIKLSKPNLWDEKYNLFGNNHSVVMGILNDVGSLSEQAGIDLVHFLVSVMIQAQTFASSIATVGGKIHVGILAKDAPFRWISEEAYTFEGKPIPKFHNHA